RPKQWTKNVLFVFPAIIFDKKLFDFDYEFVDIPLFRVIVACILLIIMSGTVYIINDLVDIEKDKQHPKKKSRPLPSGQLPIRLAQFAAIVLPLVTLIIAYFFDFGLFVVLLVY